MEYNPDTHSGVESTRYSSSFVVIVGSVVFKEATTMVASYWSFCIFLVLKLRGLFIIRIRDENDDTKSRLRSTLQ